MNPDTTSTVPVEIAQTKQHRKDLDEVLQRLKRDTGLEKGKVYATPGDVWRPSAERMTAILKIQEAIMWLGMDLKEQGTSNPYPQSYNPQSAVIEKTADGLKL